jgi:hypothetical protein
MTTNEIENKRDVNGNIFKNDFEQNINKQKKGKDIFKVCKNTLKENGNLKANDIIYVMLFLI